MRTMAVRGFTAKGVLVTGASSGIGEGLARRLGREGARCVLLARREEALVRVAQAIRAEGGEAHVLPCDFSEPEAAHAAGLEAERRLAPGGVDLLVNNAGYGGHRTVLEWPLEDIVRMTAVNHLSSVAVTKAVLPAMVERGRGALVFVASVAGRVATPLEAPYAATKAAMLAFAEALSCEVEDRGIHVMTVCPGVIDTPFFGPEDLERMPAAARRGMVPVDGLVDAILRSLARGHREITWPRSIAVAYPVKALFPRTFRRIVKRMTLG
jgi:short-subunit dehydrogenase